MKSKKHGTTATRTGDAVDKPSQAEARLFEICKQVNPSQSSDSVTFSLSKLKEVLNTGVDINAADAEDNHKTAIMHAALNNNTECVKALIEHVADNSEDLLSKSDDYSMTVYHHAVSAGSTDVIKLLMNTGSASVLLQPDKRGYPAWHYAILRGHKVLLQDLLRSDVINSNINIQGNFRGSALHVAALLEDEELSADMRALLGQNCIDIDLQNAHGTALHLAVESHNVKSARLLIKNKANTEIKDTVYCLTPLQTAIKLSNREFNQYNLKSSLERTFEMIATLLDHGAKSHVQRDIQYCVSNSSESEEDYHIRKNKIISLIERSYYMNVATSQCK